MSKFVVLIRLTCKILPWVGRAAFLTRLDVQNNERGEKWRTEPAAVERTINP